eukprot:3852795-Heterocapsa_arctica.AAC.1
MSPCELSHSPDPGLAQDHAPGACRCRAVVGTIRVRRRPPGDRGARRHQPSASLIAQARGKASKPAWQCTR